MKLNSKCYVKTCNHVMLYDDVSTTNSKLSVMFLYVVVDVTDKRVSCVGVAVILALARSAAVVCRSSKCAIGLKLCRIFLQQTRFRATWYHVIFRGHNSSS